MVIERHQKWVRLPIAAPLKHNTKMGLNGDDRRQRLGAPRQWSGNSDTRRNFKWKNRSQRGGEAIRLTKERNRCGGECWDGRRCREVEVSCFKVGCAAGDWAQCCVHTQSTDSRVIFTHNCG